MIRRENRKEETPKARKNRSPSTIQIVYKLDRIQNIMFSIVGNRTFSAVLMASIAILCFEGRTVNAFLPMTTIAQPQAHRRKQCDVLSPLCMTNEEDSSSSTTATRTAGIEGVFLHESIDLRDPTLEERGKGGVEVAPNGSIKALEVLARIPRDLIVSSVDAPKRALEAAAEARNLTWATDLTAAALVALHPTEEELVASAASTKGDSVDAIQVRKDWVRSWEAGGWATDGADLGPDDVNFGPKDVTGSLLSTGSDNDHNIYAKFRMPCHPVLLRASIGLGVLTKCTEDDAREALTARGFTYRSMRDALQPLILESSERPKGSVREKRCWDVADTLSRVLSRATTLEIEDDDATNTLAHAIVPIHERLEHSTTENSKLVASGDEILLVATRDITGGEAITRDYGASPRLPNDKSEGALHLLLQFGLPPKSWPATE